MGEKKKVLADERQQIFDDRKTWDLGHKKSGDNGLQTHTNKTAVTFHIKHPQDRMDDSKKRFASLPDTAADSDKNYFSPTIKSQVAKVINKSVKLNETIGEAE